MSKQLQFDVGRVARRDIAARLVRKNIGVFILPAVKRSKRSVFPKRQLACLSGAGRIYPATKK